MIHLSLNFLTHYLEYTALEYFRLQALLTDAKLQATKAVEENLDEMNITLTEHREALSKARKGRNSEFQVNE